jgi:hypothetical protein
MNVTAAFRSNRLTIYRLTQLYICNIRFVLLKSQHVSTTLSGHHQVIQMFIKCSIELQYAFTFHIPYL